jgi:hypothetical protein
MAKAVLFFTLIILEEVLKWLPVMVDFFLLLASAFNDFSAQLVVAMDIPHSVSASSLVSSALM